MKKLTSVAFVALYAFACLTFTGCGRGGENQVVELDGTSPPPTLNQVQMEQYEQQMKSQGQSNPGGN